MKKINNTHPRYDEYVTIWTKARDFYNGEESVKEQGTTYLPMSNDITQQGEEQKYNSYKARSPFYEVTSRTVDGLVGIATHKPPTFTLPTSMGHEDDYMQGETTAEVMVQDIISENIIAARQGLLVDRNGSDTPYIVQYTAEQIINWHFEGDVLVFVVLKEMSNVYDPTDPYNTSEEEQYRELRLDPRLDDNGDIVLVDGQAIGVYTQNVWKEIKGQWTIIETTNPNNRGKALDHIPFIFTSKTKLGTQIDKAPIMPVVNSNNHHYQLAADYAHALHYVAMPTLAMYGVNEEGSEKVVGGDVYMAFDDASAKAEYVEISGQGLPSMERALDRIEEHIAHLGSRLLQSRSSGVESAEAIRLTQSAETSTLITIVNVAEQALQAAFDEIAEWENISQEVAIDLNKDFVDVNLPAGEVDALVRAYTAKTISLETLLYNLQKGELLPVDRTIEEEMEMIEAEKVVEGPLVEEDDEDAPIFNND